MHTIHESTYRPIVIKLPSDGNNKAKKINKEQEVTTNGMDALDDIYTDHPCIDWYKTRDILNIFQKGSVFGLHDYQFWECLFTLICCAKGK